MHGLLQDLRFGLRQLAAKPGFTAAAIITLALGIGANTAVFSVLNGYLLKPLPYPQSDRLVKVGVDYKAIGTGHFSMSVPLYELIRENATALSSTAIYNYNYVNARIGGGSTVLPGVVATGSLFKTLGVKPALGHEFSSAASEPGKGSVAVISHHLWRDSFSADRDIIGQMIQLDGKPVRIIGVMPKGFIFPDRGIEIWTPLTISPEDRALDRMFMLSPRLIGRLKPDASLEALQTQLDAVRAHVGRVVSADTRQELTDAGFFVHAKTWRQAQLRGRTQTLLLLQGAVLLVLLMTCVNVANLLLSRILGRSHEIAMRSALGARRAILSRQLLIESLCLAIPGGLVGVGLGWLGLHYYAALAWGGVGGLFNKALDWRVGLAALAMVGITVIIVSVLPIRYLAKVDLQQLLQQGGRGAVASGGARRVRSALVTIEMTLATMLLAASGLLLHSFVNLQAVDPGYRTDNILIAGLLAPRDARTNNGALNNLFGDLLTRVRALPGVEAAGLAGWAPMGNSSRSGGFTIRGRERSAGNAKPQALQDAVDGDYFRAIGLPILRGRNFDSRDTSGSRPVAIIDSTLAHKYFDNTNPIGQQVQFSEQWYTIIGVVPGIKPFDLTKQGRGTVYLNAAQAPGTLMHLVIYTAISPDLFAEPLRKTIAAVNPSVAVYGIESMHDRIVRSLGDKQRTMTLLLVFGGIALALAVVGIYGVLNYAVRQRVSECGVRLALGALPTDLLWLIIRDGLKLLTARLVVGLALAVALGYVLSSRLFGVVPFDLLTLAGTALVLAGTTLAACYIPARRAATLDPATAMIEQ
ncbi:MAG TPA: ABC transporter permease [Gammaproteobacteria bacterium]|nr:ABC transporter permease [Gammaproteobacteria bacterium]